MLLLVFVMVFDDLFLYEEEEEDFDDKAFIVAVFGDTEKEALIILFSYYSLSYLFSLLFSVFI